MSAALPPRLAAAAELVPPCALFADIGTDHGLLPAFLLASGRAESVVCTDISPAPLSRAKACFEERGLSARFYVGNGLQPLAGLRPDCAAVCGMGGELIAAILDAAPQGTEDTAFVLQPMTRAAALRAYLASAGLGIADWRLVHDSGRLYEVILADRHTPAETEARYLLAGRKTAGTAPLWDEYIARCLARAEKELAGLRSASVQDPAALSDALSRVSLLREIEAAGE